MTKTRNRFVAALLTAGFLASPAAAQSGVKLNDAEIRAALFGNTLVGSNPNGSTWDLYVAADGAAIIKGRLPNGNAIADKGRATVENGKWCVAWQRLRNGEKVCQDVTRQTNGFVNRNADGSVSSNYTVYIGNAAGLN